MTATDSGITRAAPELAPATRARIRGARPAGERAAGRRRIRIGLISLTDCAPLVMAHELGFFQAEGLSVSLHRESSWASIRDKLAYGLLDAAHMLAGIPLASALGISGPRCEMITGLSLGLNGNAITVSRRLHRRMAEADPSGVARPPVRASALKSVIEADRARGAGPLTFASVFEVSSHHYQLRYWLAEAGIDPDRDVRIVVVPPAQMVAQLARGRIDGFCVGEPWNTWAVRRGLGHALISSYELWQNGPEKVLAVTADWARRDPESHRAVLRAVLRAQAWLEGGGNRGRAADRIAGLPDLALPPWAVRPTLVGRFARHPDEPPEPMPDFHVFHRYAAAFPWRSHALWFLTQMSRWGQIAEADATRAVAERVYRPDIYRAAAREVGRPAPRIDWKTEGAHAASWVLEEADAPIPMGPDRFLDGRVFDPSRPAAYLRSFAEAGPMRGRSA